MHGSGDDVRAMYTTNDRARAVSRARAWTREHRREMASVGGSSGRYRAVEVDNSTRKGDVVGQGHWVDRHYQTVE